MVRCPRRNSMNSMPLESQKKEKIKANFPANSGFGFHRTTFLWQRHFILERSHAGVYWSIQIRQTLEYGLKIIYFLMVTIQQFLKNKFKRVAVTCSSDKNLIIMRCAITLHTTASRCQPKLDESAQRPCLYRTLRIAVVILKVISVNLSYFP